MAKKSTNNESTVKTIAQLAVAKAQCAYYNTRLHMQDNPDTYKAVGITAVATTAVLAVINEVA